MNIFYIKKGDTYPNITTILSDENGIAVNLLGCSVDFVMSQDGINNLMIDSPAVVTDQSQVPNVGKCYYDWQDGDTDIEGTYLVEWRVTFPSGKKATFPRSKKADNFNKVVIQPIVE